jgi:hypothetical protein
VIQLHLLNIKVHVVRLNILYTLKRMYFKRITKEKKTKKKKKLIIRVLKAFV